MGDERGKLCSVCSCPPPPPLLALLLLPLPLSRAVMSGLFPLLLLLVYCSEAGGL